MIMVDAISSADITKSLQAVIPIHSFLFNPSISRVVDNTFIISIRSLRRSLSTEMSYNPIVTENPQHPWCTGWKNIEHNATYIVLAKIKSNVVSVIQHPKYPLKLDACYDARLFRYYEDSDYCAYIVYYNYDNASKPFLIRKDGETCSNWCQTVSWNQLIVNKRTLEPILVEKDNSSVLCINISEQIEKNWTLFTYTNSQTLRLLNLYSLSPTLNVYEIDASEIGFSSLDQCVVRNPIKQDARLIQNNIPGSESSESVVMVNDITGSTIDTMDPEINSFFKDLEKLYVDPVTGKKKLMVSGSSTAYQIGDGVYQAVGHIKIDYNFIMSCDLPAAKMLTEILENSDKNWCRHSSLIYFTFLYRFTIENAEPAEYSAREFVFKLTRVTNAFVHNTSKTHYYLNFAAGQEILPNGDTLISYGDGDYSSHILSIPKQKLESMLKPVSEIKPKEYLFEVI